MVKPIKIIKKSEYLQAIQKAAFVSLFRDIVANTPGRGIVADGWDVNIVGDNVIIDNKEFNSIVIFLEKGTIPHIIQAKNKKALRWKVGPGDRFAFAKKVRHPGIEARRFVQNVLQDSNTRRDFERAFEKELNKFIT